MIKFNFDKKGIIILSNYRAGGTQFQHFVDIVAEDSNVPISICGEIDTTFNNNPLSYTLNSIYGVESKLPKVFLLNNPIAISALHDNDKFDQLTTDFEFIYLSRKNTVNSLLSLGLWEEFIGAKLFQNRRLWTKENMLKFHNDLLTNPIPFHNITVGFNDDVFVAKDPIINFNFKCMTFANMLRTVKNVAKEYKMQEVIYEEYEEQPDDFINNRLNYLSSTAVEKIKKTYKYKIPYISNNYLDYYDNTTKVYLDEWGLVNQ